MDPNWKVIVEAKQDRKRAQEATVAAEAALASANSDSESLRSQLGLMEEELQKAREEAAAGHRTDIEVCHS